MEGKVDRRTIKTKKAIKNAIAKLITEKEVDKITVKDIAETADINRKTFYNYYANVNDAFSELENEIINQIHEVFADLDLAEVLAAPKDMLKKFNDIINANLIYKDYAGRRDAEMDNKLTLYIKEELSKAAQKYVTAENSEAIHLAIEFICEGLIGTYHRWFVGDIKMSLDELANHLGSLLFYGLGQYLKDAGFTVPALPRS